MMNSRMRMVTEGALLIRPPCAAARSVRHGKTRTLGVIMRSAVLMLAILLASSHAYGADVGRPRGTNCDLTAPPDSAGEETKHGVVLRIYPRAKDIDARYTGCQVVLAPAAGNWEVVALTRIIKGDAVRVWSAQEGDKTRLACRFRKGKLVQGDPAKCPNATSLILRSLAPGCVEKIQEAAAKQGLGAPRPSACEDE